jgi:hypothetical protein
MNLLDRIETEVGKHMKRIAEAAGSQNLAALQHLTKEAGELQEMKTQVVAIEQRLARMGNGSSSLDPSKLRWLRELPVMVTQGMINQNLLTLTDHVNRGAIRPGEVMTIETSTGRKFSTELLASGNKLRERGEIGRFYKDAAIRPQNVVILREVTPGSWSLTKA